MTSGDDPKKMHQNQNEEEEEAMKKKRHDDDDDDDDDNDDDDDDDHADGDDDGGQGSPFLYIQAPDRPPQRLLLVINCCWRPQFILRKLWLEPPSSHGRLQPWPARY